MNTLLTWGGALLATGVLVAIHLLTFNRPDPKFLPTARFVPDSPARQLSRQRRLSDVALLVIRCAAIVSLAAVLAPPHVSPPKAGKARVVLLDVSRAAAPMNSDSLVRSAAEGARTVTLITFSDTAFAATETSTPDTAARGSLSVGLIAAMAEGYRLGTRHDSVEIMIVSPVLHEELDAGTMEIARGWPGSLRLYRSRPGADAPRGVARRVEHQLAVSDAAGAASHSALGEIQARPLRVIRDFSQTDSTFADEGGILLVWPHLPTDSVRVRAVVSERTSFIAPLGRGTVAANGDVLAWWDDGAPAVVEQSLGRGCVRHIGIEPPVAGDVALRPGLTALLTYLSAPCGMRDATPASDSAAAFLTRAAIGSARIAGWNGTSWLVEIMLGVAIVLLLLEQWIRRKTVRVAAPESAHGGVAT